MKKIFTIAIIAVFTVAAFIACEGDQGPMGPKGEPGIEVDEPGLVVSLDADKNDITLTLGLNTTLSAAVNADAIIHTLIWELIDGADEILKLNRPGTEPGAPAPPVGPAPFAERAVKLTGDSVKVTGIAEGTALIKITALGSSHIPEQTTINVTVFGAATEFAKLAKQAEDNVLPQAVTITAHGFERIPPQTLDFFNEESVSGTRLTITVKGSVPGIALAVKEQGSLFRVGKGISLIIENIDLQGIDNNNRPLVVVEEGATLTIRENSGIKDNINNVPSIQANFQHFGGGVRVEPTGLFMMYDGEISGNKSIMGGGVFNDGEFTMLDGIISYNISDAGGGVINWAGDFNMMGGAIYRNSPISATAVTMGGGVYNVGGFFTMYDSAEILENISRFGGGVSNEGDFTMEGGKIYSNSATAGGGGVEASNGPFTMNGGEIFYNTSGTTGGAVVIVGGTTFTMEDGKIYDNVSEGMGGGVRVDDGGTFTMRQGCEISGNWSYYSGGGVVVISGGTFDMHGGLIDGNEGSIGGGVDVQYISGTSPATFNMYSGIISNNTARGLGGGVRTGEPRSTANIPSTVFNMYDGEIFGNKSLGTLETQGGGGVFAGGNFYMEAGRIYNNTSASGGGGVRIHADGRFEMFGGEISGNTAATIGGGVLHAGAGYVSIGTEFRMVSGTIYGSNAEAAKQNKAGTNGAAFKISPVIVIGYAQYGTFTGAESDVWTSSGNFDDTVETTITVTNGVKN